MTSKASSSECFVYITLPGQISAVTAGRFVLDKNTRGDALGRFVYGRSYLENQDAVEFDPVELKLSTRTYETGRLNGVFGALRDAGPGLWVATFNRADDRWNNTRVEHAMLRLARECEIKTAESRIETVGGKDVLLVNASTGRKLRKATLARAWSAA